MPQVCISSQSAAQDTDRLCQVWDTITADSCPHRYNFHMHTVCSDGQLKPEGLIGQAFTLGLQGLAITDHHSVEGYHQAQAWLDKMRQKNPHKAFPHLWTGVEINAILLNTDVHILGYGFDPNHQSLQLYLQGDRLEWGDPPADEVIDALHQAGGLTVLAHPARYRRSPLELIPEAAALGIDGVETYYAYRNPTPWKPCPHQTLQIQQLAQQFGLCSTCGTDTHGLSILQRL